MVYLNTLQIRNLLTINETFKKSKFITYIWKINNKDELKQFLELYKNKAATHNCYAYKYGYSKQDYGYFNDKEPNGVSGEALLNIINKKNITNIAILVVRYYGGVKLGKGNLQKAYCSGATKLLSNIELKKVQLMYKLKLRYDLKDSKSISNFLFKISGESNTIFEYKDSYVISIIIIKTKELLKEINFKIEILSETLDYF
ncbi:hypothetical protein SCORR_v1c00530 [Spiroplasma corruscae]|uniref:Impact N-terminal domain-containing protein n=1 Tax=Spiroplasma corruscae TaxID=216934 RepID=A0A222EMX4_9MOLU|nr:YigZ family protein [Spiroplasma corruscae]ASP27828.1 hypothetical protein SCORR_v1c00530 [Spiroplasma corruscae]